METKEDPEECLRSVKQQIVEFVKSDISQLHVVLNLGSNLRRRLYEYLDTYQLGVVFYTSHKQGKSTVLQIAKDASILKLNASDVETSQFVKLLQRSIPVVRESYLDYYCKILQPYTSAVTDFHGFKQDVTKMGSVQNLSAKIRSIFDSMHIDLKLKIQESKFQDLKFQDLKFMEHENFIRTSKWKHVQNIYTLENVNKSFISQIIYMKK